MSTPKVITTQLVKQQAELMFNMMDKADISVTLFSKMSRTSRATLYRWRNEPDKGVDRFRFDMAVSIALRMKYAVEQNLLPLKDKLTKGEKEATIRNIIQTVKPS